MQETKLPGYVERAITSRLARTEPYSWLTPEQWRVLAQHMYEDERIPAKGIGVTFLPRGTQNAYGHGRQRTLNGILTSAVIDHSGVTNKVPHYEPARKLYALVSAAEELKPYIRNVVLVDMGE